MKQYLILLLVVVGNMYGISHGFSPDSPEEYRAKFQGKAETIVNVCSCQQISCCDGGCIDGCMNNLLNHSIGTKVSMDNLRLVLGYISCGALGQKKKKSLGEIKHL